MMRLVCCVVALVLGCGDDDAAPSSDPLQFAPIELPGSGAITGFRFLPNTDSELLVIEHDGTVRHLQLDGDTATMLGELEVPEVVQELDCGLHSIELDPDWADNGFVYFGHCSLEYSSRITRITFDGSSYDVEESARTVIDIVEPNSRNPTNHSIGSLGFDPDGTLFFSVGDKSFTANGQDPMSLPSSFLRIEPDRTDAGGYSPASDNPFDGSEGAPEVFAYGVRYGWRSMRDRQGRYWVADVGAADAEELNLIEAGKNYGWVTCEGPCDEDGIENPVVSWSHDDDDPYVEDDPLGELTTRRVGWLGLERVPSDDDPYEGLLDDALVFGDNCIGFVRALEVNAGGEVVRDQHIGHLPHVVDWVPGPDGYVYAATFGSCDSEMTFEPAMLYRAELH